MTKCLIWKMRKKKCDLKGVAARVMEVVDEEGVVYVEA
jgi:hypothetical protein